MISSAFTHWRSAFAVLLATVGMMFSSATISRAQDAAEATEAVVAAPAEEAAAPAPETPAPPTVEQTLAKLSVGIDTIWVMVCGMLVFFMNLGFGCVESGFCRSKNCVNILSKNFVVFAVCSLGYWIIGWDLMFGLGDGEFIGKSGAFMVSGADNSPIQVGSGYEGVYTSIAWATVPLMAKFFFQLVFAGTAATIVSGAVAERIKYLSFIIFSFVLATVIYPIAGHWVWGFGYLAQEWNFWDFAGCTVVHSIGGWAALTGAIILGPRIGKFSKDGRVNAIPGHSMMAAFIGCLVLWFGWFGFNPGSTMSIAGDGGAGATLTAVNTNIAAALATLTATATSWIFLGKPDIGMTLNGCLAGLVSITAVAYFTNPLCSAIIGAIAGVTVVFSVLLFDRLKIDDPVGAISVHLVHGIFGTICVGLFTTSDLSKTPVTGGPTAGLFFGGGTTQLVAQLVGIAMVGAWTLVTSAIVWLVLKYTVGIRVSEAEEVGGLDHGEHGNEAYHGFVMQTSGH
jgi:Amt family ammonium transporter